MKQLAAFVLFVLAAILVSARAAAADVTIDAAPIFSSTQGMALGWNEIVVAARNTGTKPVKGRVEIASYRYGSNPIAAVAEAPFAVAPGASIILRIPVQIEQFGDVTVRAIDDDGRELWRNNLTPYQPSGVTMFDVSDASPLRASLGEALISPDYTPYTASRSSSGTRLDVLVPRFDPATGDPVLPDRAALYNAIDVVVMRSDILARLRGAELDALAGYVLGGGTLAVAIVRPEDVRDPTLAAFAGGSIAKQSVSAVTLRELTVPTTPAGISTVGAKIITGAKNPADATGSLAGYGGGNLHGSSFGSSAYYGLGELHILAFDPTHRPASDDPWVQVRMLDLSRRAYDRRSTIVLRLGADAAGGGSQNRVRQQLDPNESSRWGIAAAALLLCAYSVIAGPVNFSRAARKGRPLRALLHLPLLAAICFALIVGIGITAKGISGRARRLTLVEAGAGMTRGSARRFRGFFVSGSRDLTIRTTDSGSLVNLVPLSEHDEKRRMVVDRDGERLVDVSALAWQTLVVREDGLLSLGDGISMTKQGGDVKIANRAGRALRGAIVRLESGEIRYFPRIGDGESILASTGQTIAVALPEGSSWSSQMSSSSRVGGTPVHHLDSAWFGAGLERDVAGLPDAWRAIEDATGDQVDWFPDHVPTLIGQLEGGEGVTSDSGLRLESDRLLVRIVGYGGRP